MTIPFDPETLDLLALSMVPGLGPKLTELLLREFGSAAAIRKAGIQEFLRIERIGPKLAEDFVEALRTVDLATEVQHLHNHHVRLIGRHQPEFPQALRLLSGMPFLLYARGTLLPEDANAVAIVGSRNFSAYGRRMTERIAGGLARAGFTIVSGLARGIDGIAHKAALEADGRTIAVLAGGLSKIYPPEHTELAETITKSGALLTESAILQAPLPGLFPARNRIVSGLSRGVVIIEAGEKSGALITADHAAEQGREVFAVPGPIDSDYSAGCNQLLRTGARLVRSADDIIEDLQGVRPPVKHRPAQAELPLDPSPPHDPQPPPPTNTPKPSPLTVPPLLPNLNQEERRIFDFLSEKRHADEIVRACGLSVGVLTKTLMQMELKKVIRRLAGNFYERRNT